MAEIKSSAEQIQEALTKTQELLTSINLGGE